MLHVSLFRFYVPFNLRTPTTKRLKWLRSCEEKIDDRQLNRKDGIEKRRKSWSLSDYNALH